MSHGGKAQFDHDVRFLVWKRQKGTCLICRRRKGFRFRVLDHCHRCGLIRGGVCDSCNQRIGWYERVLERTAVYPSEPKSGCPHTIALARKLAQTGERIVTYVEAHRQKCANRLKRTRWHFKSQAPVRLKFGRQIPRMPVVEKRMTKLICRACTSPKGLGKDLGKKSKGGVFFGRNPARIPAVIPPPAIIPPDDITKKVLRFFARPIPQ
jgi:hypothetical protein